MTITKDQMNTKLTALIAQREVWEAGTYKQANAELYAILEQCGVIYAALKEDKKSARAFSALADDQGVIFNKGTSLALKIVRLVFGKQGHREFAYTRVIKLWFEERTEGQTLTNFVIEHGGIENVRRNVGKASSDKLTADDYRAIAEEAFAEGEALATLSIEKYMLADTENDSDYLVAIVRCDGNGIGEVLYGSNKRSLVSNALAVMGKELGDLQEQDTSKDEIAEKRKRKTENIKKYFANLRMQKTAA
jgi:hypothetical protein